ncbi:MAG: transglutaminase domain-containing protein [Frankiaceae bacterium]|nr:transglutaminase domain-containing protein [Frankiaceae bacterium]
MTTPVLDRASDAEGVSPDPVAVHPHAAVAEVASAADGGAPERVDSPLSFGLAAVSAALSGGAAAWMVGGVFRGTEARLTALLGVLIGALLAWAAARFRSSLLQYLVLPLSLLVGAALVAPAAHSGSSSLPGLVKDAVKSGRVLQPPVDFSPGWRLVLVVVLALITAAACSLAVSRGRPRLAAAIPMPLTLAASLVQPAASEIATSAVCVALVLAALTVSYAGDDASKGLNVSFELRRIGRSAAVAVLMIGMVIASSHLTFLFPQPDRDRTVPPRRPPVAEPGPDVPLFEVKAPQDAPLRLGVIDVYDVKEGAWFLPPYDTGRLERLKLPAALPVDASAAARDTFLTTFRVRQASGHGLPVLAAAVRLAGDGTVEYDPRSQTVAIAERPVFDGFSYTVEAREGPTGRELSESTGVPESVREFLKAPPVPPAVQQLLAKASEAPYARVQALRTALYNKVVAAGVGQPTDVSPARVVEILAGDSANPYEITAAEALLARWAGVPARIGYGYYGGTKLPNGFQEIRPSHGATWLELHLPPYGWVPVVGVPPRAQPSLSKNQQKPNPNIRASDELGIVVYLPVKDNRGLPAYVVARYYLVRALPPIALALAALLLYPLALKRVRARRRSAWEKARGPRAQIARSYADLRDTCIDLALPGRHATPLEFYELIEPDEQHAELAWLVTRCLWGDLAADAGQPDADNARRLAASVRSRLLAAQPGSARLLCALSRSSLKDPYTREVPNVWITLQPRRRLLRRLRRVWAAIGLPRGRRQVALPSLMLVLAMFLGACSGGGDARAAGTPAPLPTRLAPSSIAGLQVAEEPKAAAAYTKAQSDKNVLVSDGRVLSMSRNGLVQAALQVAQLKPGYDSSDPEVVRAISESIGRVSKLASADGQDLYVATDASQRIYLWFPKQAQAMALLVVRAELPVGAAELLARGLIAYGRGLPYDERILVAAFAAGAGR